jgi:hypothetical protein
METRGLMMLVAGFGLMLAPAAYVMLQDKEPAAAEVAAEADAEPAADAAVEDLTEAEAEAEPTCDGPAIISTSERVDCNGDTIKDTTRRETAGGAVFVRVGD